MSYLHTPALEVGSWWRVDTDSGSDTGTTVYAHDGTDAIPTSLGTSGSTVRSSGANGTAQFWSATATLYCKELTYQGAPNGTVVTSTGATPASPSGAGPIGPTLGGPNTWTGTQNFTAATVTGLDITGLVPDADATTKGVVKLAGDLGGTAAAPTVPGLAAKANDSAVVHTSGTETVAGVKTFTSAPVVPSGAFPEAAVTNLANDLAGKAPTTRTVTAGTGLTGGGDLSADRTLAVSFGSTAGTAAAGDDTRLTGSLQKTSNLADLGSSSASRTNLGLGSSATHAATDFLQPASNLSDVASASSARTNLGLGTAATTDATSYPLVTNNLSDLASASTARTNLGLGTAATQDATAFDAAGAATAAQSASLQKTSNLSDVAVAATARTNLGVPPTTRTITAGTGLAGGGDLSTDRTLTVAYGTTVGTAAQGNDSRITGALQSANNLSDVASVATARTSLGVPPSTRTVTAGTGLTGGGDLSADRTLTVAYGTASGTAAQGNDSRITGALQAASNLSDVSSASTARTNLGLANAAISSVLYLAANYQ